MSDEEPAWRLDPKYNYSDFKIAITNKDADVTRGYDTHKFCLAFGDRKSSYFSGLLREGGRYADANELAITFEGVAARSFPSFLDFIYTGDLEESLSSERAAGLLELSSYFRVPSLAEKIKPFVMADMDASKVTEYLPSIVKLANDGCMEYAYTLAQHRTVEALLDKETDIPQLVKVMDVGFIAKLFQLVHDLAVAAKRTHGQVVEEGTIDITAVAVAFLTAHKEHLTLKDLEEVTNESFLPDVTPALALQLMKIETEIIGKEHRDKINSLQKRCVDAVSNHTDGDAESREKIYMELSKTQLAKLLSHSSRYRSAASEPSVEEGNAHHVKVLSCEPALSGCYKKDGSVLYGMIGSWEGKTGKFSIDLLATGDWALRHKSDGSEPPIVLYLNSVRSKLPPVWGWRCKDNGNPVFLLFCDGDGANS